MVVSTADYERLRKRMSPVSTAVTAARGVIYGVRGTGKSVLAAQIMQAVCPEGKGILHIDTGENWSTWRNHPDINRKKFLTIPWSGMEDLTLVIQMVLEGTEEFGYIGAIIFDEFSTMVKDDTDVMHAARVGMRIDGSVPSGESLVPEWPDYNAVMVRWRRILNMMSKIPNLHYIYLAHESDRKAKVGRDLITTGWGPSIQAGINAKIQEDVTFVGRLTSEEKKVASDPKQVSYVRELQVKPANKYEGKTRIASDRLRIPAEEVVLWINTWLDSGGELLPVEDTHEVEIEPTIAETLPDDLKESAAQADEQAISSEFATFDPL